MGFEHQIKLAHFGPISRTAHRIAYFFLHDNIVQRFSIINGLFQFGRDPFCLVVFAFVTEILDVLFNQVIGAEAGFTGFIINEGIVKTGHMP